MLSADFPSIPSDVCKTIIEKWLRFKVTLFKSYLRDLPEVLTDGFVMTEDERMRDFKILFSVLPGVVQHPQLKFEGVSSSFAELVIAQLKNITYKYMRNMETWNKEHPRIPASVAIYHFRFRFVHSSRLFLRGSPQKLH